MAIGLLLVLVLSGCGQQAALPDADGAARAAGLRLTLTPLGPAPVASDLQPRFDLAVLDARSGARVPSSLPEVITARALPGRAVAFVTVDRRLLIWRPGAGQRAIDREVAGAISPSPGGRLLAYARRPTAGGGLWLAEISSGRRWRLGGGGSACLPLFSADGERIAFVDTSPEGIASLFVVSLVGDRARAPRQLTNRGVQRRPGRAPAGFVPTPGPGALRWQGELLRWRAAGRSWVVSAAGGGR